MIRLARALARALAVIGSVSSLGHVPVARAEPNERQACIDAAVRGQELLHAGKLLAARSALTACIREVCPGMVRRDCDAFTAQATSRLPTIVLTVKDTRGADVVSGAVSLDGAPLDGALGGKAIALDPGEHRFRIQRGSESIGTTFVAHEGEKARTVMLRFLDLSSPPAPRARRVPPATWALGATTAVAAAVFGVFSGLALSKRSSGCVHDECSHATYESIETDYDVASVALGVAALAGAGTTWTYLAGRAQGPASATSAGATGPAPALVSF